MFSNSSSTPSTSLFSNNNNPSQANPNTQAGIFSAPVNPQNSTFGSLPHQQLTFGSTSGGGVLLGNPQLSGGLFNNQIQQQPQGGGGGLFSNQVQQQPPSGGLFGGQVQLQSQAGGLFGNPQPSGGLLGNSQPPSGGIFGNQIQQQSQAGGLFAGPPPPGGSFGGQLQQQSSGRGVFFSNQTQQQLPSNGVFGGQTQQQARLESFFGASPQVVNTMPSDGSVGYIGKNNPSYWMKNKDNFTLPSITTRITGHTLDEIRMKDYFNLKNDTLTAQQKGIVTNCICTNMSKTGCMNIRTYFAPNDLPGHITTLFGLTQPQNTSGGNTQPAPASGSVFTNLQLSQITPSPQNINTSSLNKSSGTTQSFAIQPISLPTQTLPVSNEAIVNQPETKELETKTMTKSTAKAKSENKSLQLSSGSFGFELNKMLFVSGLVQILEKHNMRVPEHLLDDTDFVAQLLEFLEQNGVSLPTENVPQFQINSVAPFGTEFENNDEELN